MEENPSEAITNNVLGTKNLVEVSLKFNIKNFVLISTDKAVNPVNLYGATKLVSDKLFISGNAYVGDRNTSFSVVRYGNVAGSRASVIPFFKNSESNTTHTSSTYLSQNFQVMNWTVPHVITQTPSVDTFKICIFHLVILPGEQFLLRGQLH